MKIHLTTLGCKLNESELEAWARHLANDGHALVDEARAADVIVLNTCAVTHTAARKTRQLARQLARANPQARLVLTGCFVTISPDDAKSLPNVALIVPNASKEQLVEQITNREWRIVNGERQMANRESQEPSASHDPRYAIRQQWLNADVETQIAGHQSSISNLQSPHLRTRAFVKIQDGCNLACAYCIIPHARGKARSRPRAEIIAEVNALVNAGYKEIILTGVQISAYAPSLRDLIAAILAETNVPRVRLTSIAPWEVDAALLDLWREARLCRHLHLSLQSGCDAILRQMRRPYTTAQFARAVELARTKIPDVGITTDVIVGFPGESNAQFDESLKFVERMQFARVHVFPYSQRAGTPAATLPHQVADTVKHARARQMQILADASQRAFARRFVGRELMVLWEAQEQVDRHRWSGRRNASLTPDHQSPLWSGYSDNYIRIVAPSDADLENQFTLATVTHVVEDGAQATIAQPTRQESFLSPPTRTNAAVAR